MKTLVKNTFKNKELYKKVGDAYTYLNSIHIKLPSKVKQPAKETEFSSMICPLTGALNRIGLRKYFDQIVPSQLADMSLIYIALDKVDFGSIHSSKPISESVLHQFVTEVIGQCSNQDLIARWDNNEFVLVCPAMPHEEAITFANRLSKGIGRTTWNKKPEVKCNAVVFKTNGEDIHYAISLVKAEFDKTKEAV